MLMDPFPSIKKVFALILQEEQQRGIVSFAELPNFESIGLTNGLEISVFFLLLNLQITKF